MEILTLTQKKSQAHLEMIIAFILFVGVILTFFFLIKPFSYTKEKPVENIQETILNSIKEEIGILSVIMNSDNDCYSLSEVINDYGSNFIEIPDSNNQRKFTIYFHPMFTERIISCESMPGREFQLGIYKKQDFVTMEKTADLKQKYEDNYQSLKTELGIRDDFSIQFRDFNNQQVAELTPINLKIPPVGVNVIAKEFPVQVINKNAEINNYILNLRVW